MRLRRPGEYQLQAAITALQIQAPDAEATDWAQIGELFGALARLNPSPVVELNRAVAVGLASGPAAGLALLEPLLGDSTLERYQPLYAAQAELLSRAGDTAGAARAYERAIALTANAVERAELERRLAHAALIEFPGLSKSPSCCDVLLRPPIRAATSTRRTSVSNPQPTDSPAQPDPRRWKALALLCGAFFMVILDANIVIVGLPSIDAELGFSDQGLQWVISAYALTFAGLLLLGGRAADLLGRRRVFMVGLLFFTLASLALRAGLVAGGADRGARGPGRRRGDHDADRPVDRLDDVP